MGVLRRRELIAAAVALLVSWLIATYYVASLRWIPGAFVVGLLTPIAGTLYLLLTSSKPPESRQTYRFPPTSALAITSGQKWTSEMASLEKRGIYRRRAVFLSAPQLSQSIEQLLEYISRDFIKSWYSKISPSNAFPNEVDRAIRAALKGLADHTSDLDFAEIVVTHILPIVTGHIKSFVAAERAVRGRNAGQSVTDTEELDVAVAARYKDGRVHPAATLAASKTRAPQTKHLRQLVSIIVPSLLPDNMVTSRAVLVLVQEIVTCSVLLPVMTLLSDPDMINQLIEGYGRDALRDRKTVRKLRAALDEQVVPGHDRTGPLLRLSPNDSEKSFEKFIRTIRQCDNLSEAKRYKSEILRQLKKATSGSNPDSVFIRRLDVGRKVLDQRLNQLSHQTLARTPSNHSLSASLEQVFVRPRDSFTLREVLYDASGLSYFMEYMDRANLTTYVQFWIVVDGFRNPLDGDDDDDNASPRPWTDAERRDLGQIAEAYLYRPELRISPEAQTTVKTFLRAGKSASPAQFAAAKQAVLRAQTGIFKEMDKAHFQRFKSSDLFYKWVSSDPARQQAMKRQDPNSLSPVEPVTRPAVLKSPELRRVIGSSSDLANDASKLAKPAAVRRSLDGSRAPLFDDDLDDDPMAGSVQSLDSGRGAADQGAAVDAVQAALDDLIDEGPDNKAQQALFHDDSDRGSIDSSRVDLMHTDSTGKPSLSSLGLLGTPSRRTVFSEGDLFGESEKFWEEDRGSEGTPDQGLSNDEDEIREAAPGDLGLAELIQVLSLEIEKLEAQLPIVDSLTTKAELTNNTAELRILRKSKTSLEREIRRKELQRQQYIVQESDNTLYGRASIAIKSVANGTDQDGHDFTSYVIEISRAGTDKVPGASWTINRRYSEFYDLYKALRRRFPFVRDVDFPRRQVVMTTQKELVKKRQVALEKFLQALLTIPAVCASLEFRAFLSQQAIRSLHAANPSQAEQDFVSRIYNTINDGVEDFLGNMDELSSAAGNLISVAKSTSATNIQAANKSMVSEGLADDPTQLAEAQAEIHAFEASVETTEEKEATQFITPIAHLFLELFQLHSGNNWLRGRAVVVVLQQLLGGTIERKVRESFRSATDETALAGHVDALVNAMWPNGSPRPPPPVRTERQKAASKREASVVMETLLGDMAGSVVGRRNAAAAGRRIVAVLNNERLNAHLMFTLVDELVARALGVKVPRGL